jgi:hypothetical protein
MKYLRQKTCPALKALTDETRNFEETQKKIVCPVILVSPEPTGMVVV